MRKPAFILFLITITLVYGAQYTLKLDEFLEAKAVRIAGADAFDVTLQFTPVCVRLIGVECPSKGENYYSEAYEYAANMLLDKTAWLELDVGKYDNYGRLLAYIWLKKSQEKIVSDEVVAQDIFNALLLVSGICQSRKLLLRTSGTLFYLLCYRDQQEKHKKVFRRFNPE
jgi:micrococcal nuclease